MKTCEYCGGAIAEPNEVTGWAGKWCHCWMGRGYVAGQPAIHIGPVPGGQVPYADIEKTTEEIRKQWDDFNKRTLSKGDVKKPSFSHILNLCEQLSASDIKALIGVLQQMHDCSSLASDPNGFKK